MSMMNNMFDATKHTKFTPTNPDKVLGDVNKIVCRSNWEKDFCRYLDRSPNIVKWGSELFSIGYLDQFGKRRNYFPDFIFVKEDTQGNQQTYLIEIKPSAQTKPPRRTKSKNQAKMLNENQTYIKNVRKWQYANAFCQKKGFIFKIITEHDLYG